MKNTFIIAEAGVNHNGDTNIAKKLVDVAVSAGVDAVKFQTWKTELLVSKDAPLADYQVDNTHSDNNQYSMLKRLELSYDSFIELKQYCDNKNIIFMSTPDEEESALFLNNIVEIFKIGSGELTNLPFLSLIASFNKPIILSTGMADLMEVEQAMNRLLEAGLHKDKITLLHATTNYPAPYDEVNLSAMKTMVDKFGVKVGYSDHTDGIEISIAAVALGAKVIEKHFTLDRSMEGPDHQASIEPDELKLLVSSIRHVEKSIGNGVKSPSISEIANKKIVRKSLVASRSIYKGELFSKNNITIKRPGTGISPAKYEEIIGQIAPKDFERDEIITLESNN